MSKHGSPPLYGCRAYWARRYLLYVGGDEEEMVGLLGSISSGSRGRDSCRGGSGAGVVDI